MNICFPLSAPNIRRHVFRAMTSVYHVCFPGQWRFAFIGKKSNSPLPRKRVVRLTDRPDMTLDVYGGRKTTIQQQQQRDGHPSAESSTAISLDLVPTFPHIYCPFSYLLTLFCVVRQETMREREREREREKTIYMRWIPSAESSMEISPTLYPLFHTLTASLLTYLGVVGWCNGVG